MSRRNAGIITGFIVIAFSVFLITAAHAVETYVINKAGKPWMKVEKGPTGAYKASVDDSSIAALSLSGEVITAANGASYNLEQKNAKTRVKASDGKTILTIDDRGDKIKVYRGDEKGEPWVVKKKDDKDAYKVKYGSKDAGKVKFYPEKSKNKAKDASGSEVCDMRTNSLSAAPAVCLMEGATAEEKLMLFMLFIAKDVK